MNTATATHTRRPRNADTCEDCNGLGSYVTELETPDLDETSECEACMGRGWHTEETDELMELKLLAEWHYREDGSMASG